MPVEDKIKEIRARRAKPMGRPEIPDHRRKRLVGATLSPYHQFVTRRLLETGAVKPTRKNAGYSDVISSLLEKAAQENGISEEEFLALSEEERSAFDIGLKN